MPSSDEITIQSLAPGVVMIGAESGAPVGDVIIPVRGATVVVDPAAPSANPAVLVADADEAFPVVEALYGSELAVAMCSVAAVEPVPPQEETRARICRGRALEKIVALASAQWCRATSPLPMVRTLLDVEELTLRGALCEVLDEDDKEWIAGLERHARTIFSFVAGGSSSCQAVPGPFEMVGDALELLATYLPITRDAAAIAARLLETWSRTAEEAGASMAPVKDWVRPLRPRGAALAGVRQLHAGTSTVDWDEVPFGQTSTEEDNVGGHWRVPEIGRAWASWWLVRHWHVRSQDSELQRHPRRWWTDLVLMCIFQNGPCRWPWGRSHSIYWHGPGAGRCRCTVPGRICWKNPWERGVFPSSESVGIFPLLGVTPLWERPAGGLPADLPVCDWAPTDVMET